LRARAAVRLDGASIWTIQLLNPLPGRRDGGSMLAIIRLLQGRRFI
jgi:hypothetical protein